VRPFTPRELAENTAAIARAYPAWWRRPWQSPQAHERYQLAAVRRLVAHAERHVPLYREKFRRAGVSSRDLRTLADFQSFPLTTKDEIRDAYPEGALTTGLDRRRCLVSQSSGSTGHVLSVVHQANRLAAQGLAMNRLLTMMGPYRPWHRLVYVYTAPYPARSLAGAWPMIFVPTLAPVATLVAALRHHRPRLLACYPSHLRSIAEHLGPRACRDLRLGGISVSSEPSTARERAELAALFGCAVHDEYSTEELTRVAAQCASGTYHLFEDVTFTEIVEATSARPCEVGELGEIVGTYLHNFAMPFIRYRQGDLASIRPSRCACGFRFRALEDLDGRKLDRFVLPSGRVLTSGFLLDASYSFLLDVGADITAFRLVQEEHALVRIEVVPGPRFTDATADAIRARFLELAGEPLRVEIQRVAAIAKTASGKHHPIVSRVGRDG
jgi:phenylacetate-CoA ligase